MMPLRLGCYNACNVVFIKLVSIKALDAEECKRLVGIRTNGTNTNIASAVHTISMDSAPHLRYKQPDTIACAGPRAGAWTGAGAGGCTVSLTHLLLCRNKMYPCCFLF